MKILSIDVGIKNLALCIIQTINDFPFYKIEYWEVLNLCNEEKMECCGISNKCPCKKPAKFIIMKKIFHVKGFDPVIIFIKRTICRG